MSTEVQNDPAIAVIVLTDSLYLPGTLRVLETFFQHNGRVPAIALSRDEHALADPTLHSLTSEQRLIDTESYTDIRPYKKRHSRRHGETFLKFEAFQDFGYERNLFLDSDLLCLGPTPLLLQPPDATVLAARDSGFRPTRSYKGHPEEINSGVLLLNRSILGSETVAALQTIARAEPGRGGYNSGDQSVINKWIHRNKVKLQLLPQSYNLIKKDYGDFSGVDECRLLHYGDRKPWFRSELPPKPLEALWRASNETE